MSNNHFDEGSKIKIRIKSAMTERHICTKTDSKIRGKQKEEMDTYSVKCCSECILIKNKKKWIM